MSESPTDDFIINVDTWALQEDPPDRCIMCGCCGGKRDMDCYETECGCHDD